MSVYVSSGGSEKVSIDGARAHQHISLLTDHSISSPLGAVPIDMSYYGRISGALCASFYNNNLYTFRNVTYASSNTLEFHMWNGSSFTKLSYSIPANPDYTPAGDMAGMAMCVFNNELHVIAMYRSNGYSIRHCKYDGTAWTTLGYVWSAPTHGTLLSTYYENFELFILDGSLNLIFGDSKGSYHFIYDESNNSWNNRGTLSNLKTHIYTSTVFNNNVYLFGTSGYCYIYNGTSYTTKTSPAVFRAACTYNDSIYLINQTGDVLNPSTLYKFNGSSFSAINNIGVGIAGKIPNTMLEDYMYILGCGSGAGFMKLSISPTYKEAK
jgi:hypothetical protein